MMSMSSGASGPSGDFGAAPFDVLADFQVGLFTGAAEMFYPIDVPAPAAGPAPQVGVVVFVGCDRWHAYGRRTTSRARWVWGGR